MMLKAFCVDAPMFKHLMQVKLVMAVPNLQAIETVDTTKLADKLNTGAEAAGRTTPLEAFIQVPDPFLSRALFLLPAAEAPDVSCLALDFQVDTSGEDTKSGVDAEEAVTLATHILTNCPHLKLKGTCLYFFIFLRL